MTAALAALLKHRETVEPLSIGLFGPWGSGKSSQIAQLQDACRAMNGPKIRFAEFNAWSHEKADKLAAALAQAVVDELVRPLSYRQELTLAIKLAIRRHGRRPTTKNTDRPDAADQQAEAEQARRMRQRWLLSELLPSLALMLCPTLLVGERSTALVRPTAGGPRSPL
ncbi:P-loop NTPase fold protein [Chitinimonas koreensis]|uniref:P-loop NTPase fold protein n=1 Tax=Chitinimonas koreensis TaxID=356302 RepID=UPI001653FB5B|nr:P-loop NTPase fold protein [Chitinimonas koreensis]QNM97244.1 hypothetical protein H9L41_02670 [Chitinimonas koreensis]